MNGNGVAFVVLVIILVVTASAVSLYIYYGRVIMRSRVAGAPVELKRMVQMTFSGVNAYTVVTAYINLKQAGVNMPLETLEAFARKERNVLAITRKIIESKKRNDSAGMDEFLRKLQGVKA